LVSSFCGDVYNPKVVRSTMGAILRVNVESTDNLINTLKEKQKEGYKIVVTALDANTSYTDLDFKEKTIVVIGNESKGVKKEIQDIANIKVKIPMIGRTESLNASVASSLMAYEYVRKAL
jgi:TrmH family RNA methyltransferase